MECIADMLEPLCPTCAHEPPTGERCPLENRGPTPGYRPRGGVLGDRVGREPWEVLECPMWEPRAEPQGAD